MSTKTYRERYGWWQVDDFEVGVVGPDRVRFLNGMFTRDLTSMEPGTGSWAIKATAKGRIQGLVRIRVGADSVRIDLPRICGEQVVGALVDHLVADDCEIEDHTDDWQRVMVAGAEAPALLESRGLPVPSVELGTGELDGVRVVRDNRYGVPGFEVSVAPGATKGLGLDPGAQVSEELRNVWRIEAGLPEMGPDLDEEVIALEAGLLFAIDATKGCYIGQETIARAMNLGRVRYGLVGYRSVEPLTIGKITGPDGKARGEVTSAAWSEQVGAHVGIGYLRNEVTDEALPAGIQAVSLPHVPAAGPTVFAPVTQR